MHYLTRIVLGLMGLFCALSPFWIKLGWIGPEKYSGHNLIVVLFCLPAGIAALCMAIGNSGPQGMDD
jgi:hypothetical protein